MRCFDYDLTPDTSEGGRWTPTNARIPRPSSLLGARSLEGEFVLPSAATPVDITASLNTPSCGQPPQSVLHNVTSPGHGGFRHY